MANPDDFLLNTDYEMDKIVLFKEGTFSSSTSFEHNLKFIPLVFGIWSTDPDFNSSNTLGWVDSAPDVGYTPVLSVECYATATEIKMKSAGNTNNVELYYRVYAFEPNGSMNDAPLTSTKAAQLILNTDYNYLKLFKRGVFTSPNEEFSHNLKYIPQVMAWVEEELGGETRIQPLETASESNSFGLEVTTNKIKAKALVIPGLVDKIYWRIYYDKA